MYYKSEVNRSQQVNPARYTAQPNDWLDTPALHHQNLTPDSFHPGYVFLIYIFAVQAILSRKLIVPEMEEVLKKVAKLSITGANAMIRIHCRQVLEQRQGALFYSNRQKYFEGLAQL